MIDRAKFEMLRGKAEEIIENYAVGHGVTAFVAGHLGGQFGWDRVPLTALTTCMINDLCNLYEITDNAAKIIYLGKAIARLTKTGTFLGMTFLNWIPFAGPAVNGVVSYGLTRDAGFGCINDIRNDKLTLWKQLEGVVVDSVADSLVHSSFVNDTISDKLDDMQLGEVERAFSSELIKDGLHTAIVKGLSTGQSPVAPTCDISESMELIMNSSTPADYEQQINRIYLKHLGNIPASSDLKYINGQCGKVYEEISNLNISCGLWANKNVYDHFLAFVIAGWVLSNVKCRVLYGLTQDQVADGITSQIFEWVNGENASHK